MRPIVHIITMGLQNFVRNAWLSLITLTIIILGLLMVNMIISADYFKSSIVESLKNRVDFPIYFRQAVTEAEVAEVVKDLQNLPEVKEVQVRSPEDNLNTFSSNFPDLSQDILPALDGNPFYFSLIVKTEKLENYEAIVNHLTQAAYAEKIEAKDTTVYKDAANRVTEFTDKFNFFALIFAAFFLLVAIIVVFNTIRISIFTHKEEIGIMKLVGATNWYVRAPFLIEAILYSFVGVLISALIIYPLLLVSHQSLQSFFGEINVDLLAYYARNFWQFFILQFVGICLLNLISTALAIRKYLRV